MATLLAVDLGLRAGLALFGSDGKLRWYRSTNFGTRERLRRAIPAVMAEATELEHLVAEGDRRLFQRWEREALRLQVDAQLVTPERWRRVLLYHREQRSGIDAKAHAGALARRVIVWSGLPRARTLRHDAAEAILIGLWAVLELGWLAELPEDLRDGR